MTGGQFSLAISDLHASGTGVAHHPDFGHVYVPFAFPGETVDVEITGEARAGQWNARRLNIPQHCAHAADCGGCLWPGAPYDAQLEWKKTLLMRAARALPEITTAPVTLYGDDRILGTRSRVHLHANFFRGKLNFGFYARASRRLVPVADCPVAETPVRTALHSLAVLRDHAFENMPNFGFGIEIDTTPAFVLYGMPERRAELAAFAEMLQNHAAPCRAFVAFTADAPLTVHERVGNLTLYSKPGCFQQVNRRQSRVIREIIGTEIARLRPRILFDLYSGAGNYSLPFHRDVGQIFGADDNPAGIAVAVENVQCNGILNATYCCADAGAVLENPAVYGWPRAADFVVIDPARWGMSKSVLAALPRLKSRKIIYISNHTASFVRDARDLLRLGMKIEALHLVDFFPFTPLLDIVSLWNTPDSV